MSAHGQGSTGAYPPTTPVRVLIVEDHQLLSEALARALGDQPDIAVVGLARSVADALERMLIGPIDVVLLDHNLPDGDGLVVARHLRQAYPSTRIIMVTAREDREMIRAALAAGCSGFIGKSESFIHLPNAIRSAAQGTTAISPAVAARLVAPDDNEARRPGFTERELDVLSLMAQGASSSQIAEQLFLSEKTMRNYYNRINLKLNTHSKLEAVAKAIKLGLVDVDVANGADGSAATDGKGGQRRRR